MAKKHKTRGVGTAIVLVTCFVLSGYFAIAAVQGEYGLFRRIAIEAESAALVQERATLTAEVARMENLTRRLSDDHLDLDLLDERARDVLGYLRYDELVIR